MNRRAFLRSVSVAVAGGLLLPEIAKELIAPKRTIFLPRHTGMSELLIDPALAGLGGPAYLAHERAMFAELTRALNPVFVYEQHEMPDAAGKIITFRRPRVLQPRALQVG